ncbi:MAG: hypothetical protein ABSG65_01800 [Bryobacteraceae bacterium]|jgi:hypothetical protein
MLAALAALPGEVLAEDQFWVAPAPCCGYLWSVSTRGRVWRINPAQRTAEIAANLGESFGSAPFCIRSLAIEEGRPPHPHLIAADGRCVRSIDLANRCVFDWIAVSDGGRLLANMQTDGYLSVEADGEHVYALERRDSGCYLLRRNLATTGVDDFFVSAGPVGGPFMMDGRVCIYSRGSLFVLGDGGLAELRFLRSALAIVYPREARGFQLASGTSPWHAPRGRGDVYLPGIADQSPAYLYLNVIGYPDVSRNIPVEAGAAFSRDVEDRLVMTKPGSIGVFDGPIAQIRQLEQVVPMGAEYVDGPFTAAFVKTAGAGEKIRFYFEDKAQDAPLPGPAERIDVIGFFRTGSCLVLAYFKTKDSSLGFAVWDI